MRSYSNFFQSISRLLVQVSQQSLSFRKQAYHPWTCTYVRLLGSCFKTGRREPFCQQVVRVEKLSKTILPSPDKKYLFSLESYQAHSPVRRQASMSSEISSSKNKCWLPRQEAPHMSCSKQKAALTLQQSTFTMMRSNLAKMTGSIRFPFSNFRHF